MIALIDYGAGNVTSVANALTRLGCEFDVSGDAKIIESASAVILPGVGHFGQLAVAIDGLGLRNVLLDVIRSGRPYLGICLGMQLLFDGSEEAANERGLSVMSGQVKRFDAGKRVPHMGWNLVEPAGSSGLLKQPDYFYFAHSYAVFESAEVAATTCYAGEFVSAVRRDRVFGVQFHPEKSGEAGAEVLRKFVEVARC